MGITEQGSCAKGNGNAVDAIFLGLLSIIPGLGFVIGLVGIIFAICSLMQKTTRKWMAITGLVISLILPFVGVFLMLEAVYYSKGLARQTGCQANISFIAKVITMYRSSNDGTWPANIGVLKEYGVTQSAMHCPDDQGYEIASYFFYPPADLKSAPADPDALILCEIERLHRNGSRLVLCANLTVKLCATEDDFQQMLAKPCNAAFAAEYRKAVDDRPQQIKAISALKDIELSVRHYQREHEKSFPPDLAGYSKEQWFYQRPDVTNSDDERDAIVVCELSADHYRGGRAVLYANGEMYFVDSDESFQTELAKPINAKFAEALRQFEAGRP